MASKLLPVQAFATIARPACRRAPCLALPLFSCAKQGSRRAMTTEVSTEKGIPTPPEAPTPRWQQTPPGMKAPVRLRGPEEGPHVEVNSDPEKLDRFYVRMLGEGGDKMLSEEVKWQAVTHKSFDQGRRGFNDRLAYLGKQLVTLQATLALIQDPASYSQKLPADPYNRTPFQHPSLEGLEVLSSPTLETLMSKKRLAALGRQYELDGVMRWIPRKPSDFQLSGISVVLTQAMYAVVGAVALEKGGAVANQVARNRILKPLGFHIGAN
ncbi:RNase III domain-containing protein [Coccidioides immitis RS]|uniref:RNase III domain-containing protein n=4 Tax=Coccidioides immitis TaxID=5501 RepID=J3K8I8_COCIM|nr:RNase III domain-containing protein [Coccidioides immitis RS]KMP03750.1 hypothetical protein CIRG_03442 [Coccidioides immitis RMSCC 2394]KMU74720.1 hypothetical protein CISG_00650 [Coccidioides immitis RMSCC 3703]KMU83253.1 hypothetical protein CIHG_01035 [Coccidioides immitis H538.4]TPX23990.1 hypothetical protein DIZ76_013333 [Coccidioides immitis]EAS31139.3 RNase III domain-containing protein [Coccidioides immitis RS]